MNAGGIVNTGAMVNLTTAPEPLSVSVVTTQLKPLCGNIRVCQGCRGSLRLPNGSVPAPPFDIVARMETLSFRDADGTLHTPMRPSAAHYHA